jgi:hypothetical protein
MCAMCRPRSAVVRSASTAGESGGSPAMSFEFELAREQADARERPQVRGAERGVVLRRHACARKRRGSADFLVGEALEAGDRHAQPQVVRRPSRRCGTSAATRDRRTSRACAMEVGRDELEHARLGQEHATRQIVRVATRGSPSRAPGARLPRRRLRAVPPAANTARPSASTAS